MEWSEFQGLKRQESMEGKQSLPAAKHASWHVLSLQLRPTLCDPVDCSLPGSYVHGILQARILEWVAMSSSRGMSDPGTEGVLHWHVGSLPLAYGSFQIKVT